MSKEEILYCQKCKRRETFAVNVCLACGREVEDLPDARVKAVMDFTFDTLSNVIDTVAIAKRLAKKYNRNILDPHRKSGQIK